MIQEHRLTTLDSGVRIVTEAMPSVRSASLGLWIGTGSRSESEEQAGLSHLLEHLLFKGSSKYSSIEIDQIFDRMGAELNAGTGKETTSVYARVIDQHLPEAFDVMSDMVFRPALQEIDSERAVILEEIAMYEDDPQEKVFDLLGEAVFGDFLPNMTYMLSHENKDTMDLAWKTFVDSDGWKTLKSDPQYADTATGILNFNLRPFEGSEM